VKHLADHLPIRGDDIVEAALHQHPPYGVGLTTCSP
jgi:hypothetical protein